MKKVVMGFLSVVMLVSCNAQTDKNRSKTEENTDIEKIEPKIKYKINKEYDENGNLIRLDSTYTYYYSNIDPTTVEADSIFKSFNKHFSMNSTFDESFFDDFFKQDSYLKEDFFSQDFFRGDAIKNEEIIRKMMARMDSLKNEFLLEQFPLIPDKKDPENN